MNNNESTSTIISNNKIEEISAIIEMQKQIEELQNEVAELRFWLRNVNTEYNMNMYKGE